MAANRHDESIVAPTDPALEAGYLDHAGARLFYEVAGAGDALVLAHAGIADHTMWDQHMADFARRRRVIRYDLRAFGKSVTDAVEFSNGEDLLALLDHLAIERAALVGVSYGSRAPLEAALLSPERVDALVMVSPSLSGLDHEPTVQERTLLERDEAFEEAGDWEGMADNDVVLWVDGPGQPPGRAHAWVRQKVKAMALYDYVSDQLRYPTQGSTPRLRSIVPPLIERLAEVDAPTLVVQGALDTSMTAASADALVRGVTGAERNIFADCAHMLPMERPQLFVDTVLDFLDRASGA
jgi:pimeloyl-ACP methyl ester carboxylesterase